MAIGRESWDILHDFALYLFPKKMSTHPSSLLANVKIYREVKEKKNSTNPFLKEWSGQSQTKGYSWARPWGSKGVRLARVWGGASRDTGPWGSREPSDERKRREAETHKVQSQRADIAEVTRSTSVFLLWVLGSHWGVGRRVKNHLSPSPQPRKNNSVTGPIPTALSVFQSWTCIHYAG